MFFSSILSVYCLLSCFVSQIPFSHLCFFLFLSCAFVQHQSFYVSKKKSYKTPLFGQVGGCNKMFLNNLCFSNVKVMSLSGPLDRLNAILSLLHPSTATGAPSAIGSAIGRPLSRPISHPNTGGSPQPPRSKLLWETQPRDGGATASKTPLKQALNKTLQRPRSSTASSIAIELSAAWGSTKKLLFFLGGGKIMLMFKKLCENRYVSTLLKNPKGKTKYHFGFYVGQIGGIIWAKFVVT